MTVQRAQLNCFGMRDSSVGLLKVPGTGLYSFRLRFVATTTTGREKHKHDR